IRTAMEKLATESQALGQALYKDSGAGGAPGSAGEETSAGGAGSNSGADDVVDAEIVDEEPGSSKK
ncbi:MAG: molecular chaperone DnaK, partial [Pseudonocardiaceae bacterium]